MSIQTRETLKSWFLKGMKPLASQFADWIDSFWHKNEQLPLSSVEGLESQLAAKQNKLTAGSNITISGSNVISASTGIKNESDPVFSDWQNGTSIAAGENAYVINDYSVCIGTSSEVYGRGSIAIGNGINDNRQASNNSISLGNGIVPFENDQILIGDSIDPSDVANFLPRSSGRCILLIKKRGGVLLAVDDSYSVFVPRGRGRNTMVNLTDVFDHLGL